MRGSPTEMTLKGFADYFGGFHRDLSNHKFVWVLGAGASVASGIPLGAELVDRWIEQMQLMEDGGETPPKSWATAEQLGIEGFQYEQRADFYPQIYQRRYGSYPEEGFAFLEGIMSGKDPSPGYSILAAALAAHRHNVVITTNFDNLVAEALSIYTDTFPLVAGHESLAGFVRASMRRPMVCKIHRDLLLAPQSDPTSLGSLHDDWRTALRALFQQYTPLFIGYGGNDATLMKLLASLSIGDIRGRAIWCYHERSILTERIRNVVGGLDGYVVKVPDFDQLMVLLGEQMGIGALDQKIDERAKARTEQYRDRIGQLDILSHPCVARVFAETVERSGAWWRWHQKAQLESDPERQEQVYRMAIMYCPKNAELYGHFANFMRYGRGDFGQAEELYRTALGLDPRNAIIIADFANFMAEVKRDPVGAEDFYRRAINLDSMNATLTEKFANFMTKVRKYDEAEQLYWQVLELDPGNAVRIHNFANFLTEYVGKHIEADKLYRRALKLEPQNVTWLNDFANFLWHVYGNYAIEVGWLYQRALELDPRSVSAAGNYAGFLLARELLGDSLRKIELAKSLNGSERNQLAAEVALYEAIARRARQEDDTPAIQELKKLLSGGFPRRKWNFDAVLALVEDRLSLLDYKFFSALAASILNGAPFPDLLFHFRQWSDIVKDSLVSAMTDPKPTSESSDSDEDKV